jgi:hypothetical protein
VTDLEKIMPLTPDEAEAMAEPAVQRRILVINRYLALGERLFVVPDGLAAPIERALAMKGWHVELGPDLQLGSRSVYVRRSK